MTMHLRSLSRTSPHRRHSKRRGVTLLEVLTASLLTTMVLFSVVMALLSGTKSWAVGQGKIDADIRSQQCIRLISNELQKAMVVNVASSGKKVDYYLPKLDDTGAVKMPTESDGVLRTIRVVDGNDGYSTLEMGVDGDYRMLADHIILEDPLNKDKPYKPFIAGPGTITRQCEVMLIIEQIGAGKETVYSRIREKLYLRNIPSTTQ